MSKFYKVLLIFTLLYLTGCNGFNSDGSNDKTTNSYQSLNEIIPQKYEIEDKIEGDFNLDQHTDELILIRMIKSNERRLVILLGIDDGRFTLLLNSKSIVLNADKSTKFDPYLGVKHKRGEFSIRQVDARMNGCVGEYTFSYNSKLGDFQLDKIELTNCDNAKNNFSRTQSNFGSVKLSDFDISQGY